MNEALQPESQTEKTHETTTPHHLSTNHVNGLTYLGTTSVPFRPPLPHPSGSLEYPPIPPPQIPYLPYMSHPHSHTPYITLPYPSISPATFDPPENRRLGREIIDPLDPAAAGYAQRFGSETHKQKRKATEQIIPQLLPPTPEIQAPPVLVPEQSVPKEIPSQNQELSLPPQINVAEIMKRRKMVMNDDPIGPAFPDPEPELGPKQASVLPGIGCYSDSEPEDEELEKKVGEVVEKPTNFLSPTSASYPILPSPQISLQPPLQSKTSSGISTSAPPPKPVRVESDLVSFVPAALRVKRNSQSQPKNIKNVQNPNNLFDFTETLPVRVSKIPEKRDSVDEAYEQFMSEISQLG
jgi:hypothetical protein